METIRETRTFNVKVDIEPEDPAIFLEKNKYIKFESFLEEKQLDELCKRMNTANLGADDQCPISDSAYALYDDLLDEYTEIISDISGKNLLPTYSYVRRYAKGEELISHTDRPACEYSITMTLYAGEGEWPIYFKEDDNEPSEIILKRGEFIIYKGCEISHYRNKYEGNGLIQVFLHYVDANGPYADHKFDKRSELGAQKTNKSNDCFFWYFDSIISSDMCDNIVNSYSALEEFSAKAEIGNVVNPLVNTEIRDVNKISISHTDVIASALFGYGIAANHSAWNFNVSHSYQSEYLRYDKEGHYLSHMDTYMNLNDINTRKLTVLLFLNDDFEDGKFYIQIGHDKMYPPQSKGTVIVFPSFLVHGVENVTKGIRYSIVTWVLGPSFR